MSSPVSQPQRIDFHGMPAIHLRAPDGAEAIVMEHGAHIVSWKPVGGVERLYLSPDAVFAKGKAIRGGVPVIFPQFGDRGPLQGHGFARNQVWEVVASRAGEDHAMAHLCLRDSDASRALWPHPFLLELTLSISGARLDIELECSNPGSEPISFMAALHTYLAVREVEQASLQGLHGQRYYDAVKKKDMRETGTELVIEEETDRVYFDTRNPLLLKEPHRALAIQSERLPDTVVWNPWVERSIKFSDFPDKGFRHMLCVEAATIEHPVQLAAQHSWWGRQTLMAL